MTRTVLGSCSLILATMTCLAVVPSLAFAQKSGLASARKSDVASAQKRASVQKWEYRDLLKTIEIKSPPVRSRHTSTETSNAEAKPTPTNPDQLQLNGKTAL